MRKLSELGIFREFWFWYDGVLTPPGGTDDPYVATLRRCRSRSDAAIDYLCSLKFRLCHRAVAYFAFRAGMLAGAGDKSEKEVGHA